VIESWRRHYERGAAAFDLGYLTSAAFVVSKDLQVEHFSAESAQLLCIPFLMLCIFGHSHGIIQSACFRRPIYQAAEYCVNLRLALAIAHLSAWETDEMIVRVKYARSASTVPPPWRQRMYPVASELSARRPGLNASDVSWQRAPLILEASFATPLTSWRRGSGRTTRASRPPMGTTGHRASGNANRHPLFPSIAAASKRLPPHNPTCSKG